MTATADDRRNVVLTGFMGTGKSTVGRLLADELGFTFVDTDTIIENRHGSIASIFEAHGESHFRALEREVAAELADQSGLVIATGGRLMLDPVNAESLGATGRIFCLVATPDEILDRVLADVTVKRPLLAGADPYERIVELLTERAEGYRRFDQIATGSRSPAAIAAEIAALVRPAPSGPGSGSEPGRRR